MADDIDPFDNNGEPESRRDGHKSKSKVSSKDKSKKPGYPRKGRRRDEESPPPSPRDLRRDEASMSLEILSPTGSILHQQEALHRGQRLDWGFKVNLSAEKVPDPAIYTCEKCNLPILIYGRLIPCKHVFCFNCAKNATDKHCPRCKDPFARIEQSALGTVFICIHGGGKQTPRGCKRTYLSPRDLNAHVAHRHKVKSSSSSGHAPSGGESSTASKPAAAPITHPMSSLPDIDLSNLSNITDAQLKAAADILAATMNAGKATSKSSISDSAPEALMAQAPQNYVNQPPTPLMSAQPQPPHGGAPNYGLTNASASLPPFQPPPQQTYHNPAPMNMMPNVNPVPHSGGYYPHPGGPPPMTGPPPTGPPPTSNYGAPPMQRGGPMMSHQHSYGK